LAVLAIPAIPAVLAVLAVASHRSGRPGPARPHAALPSHSARQRASLFPPPPAGNITLNTSFIDATNASPDRSPSVTTNKTATVNQRPKRPQKNTRPSAITPGHPPLIVIVHQRPGLYRTSPKPVTRRSARARPHEHGQGDK
jgi:hypothetical protein